jgi:tRNA-2-methylthio-N6-dimethylallyladenosine synthase
MNRKYTREEYLDKIKLIREYLPECAITTDIICGFCDETEEDHALTLQTMQEVMFDSSFMFIYSERSGTFAQKHLKDNVPLDVKHHRLEEVIALQKKLSEQQNEKYVGKDVYILVEGPSKRNKDEFFGRTTTNKVVVFRNDYVLAGKIISVKIIETNSATLFGQLS